MKAYFLSRSYSASTVSLRGEAYTEVSVSDEKVKFDWAYMEGRGRIGLLSSPLI